MRIFQSTDKHRMHKVPWASVACPCAAIHGQATLAHDTQTSRPHITSFVGRILWLIALLTTIGCQQQPEPELDIAREVVERGPLKFTVEASPKQVLLGDPVSISLHVHTPDEYEVQILAVEDWGVWTLRAANEPDPRPAPEGGLDWRRTFTIDSFTAGIHEIPALTAKYAHKPDTDSEKTIFENELVTNPLEIEVRSALTTQDNQMRPRDITGTLTPHKTFWETVRGGVIAGVILAAIVVAVLLIWLLQRRRRREAPQIAPEVWALQMLGRLRAEEVAAGQARGFYYQLSEIVRAYIEKKFTLAAPEMTTEEFLNTLARDRTALPYDADQLRVFLESCDIVKYAAFKPQREDAEQTLETARAFVNKTAAAAAHRLETGATDSEASTTVLGGQAA